MFRIIIRRRRRKAGGSAAFKEHKERAAALVKERIDVFNEHYRFSFNRISIKNHSSRWGSCSKKGNLNFNFRIALLPERLADYIIVHELCHLGEFNHSPAFWALVSQTIPDYRTRKRELRDFEKTLADPLV